MNQIMSNLKIISQDVWIYVFVPHVVLKHLTALVAPARMKFALNVEKI
jgi:hypothetical protein